MMRIVVATLAYCWAFQFAYVSYIYPTYGYANFRYFPQSGEQNILTFILAFLPTLFSRKSESPSSYGAAIIFVLCYVPAIVMVPYMLDAAYAPVMKIQMSLMASMSVLFIASALGSTDAVAKHSADKRLLQLVGLFTSIALTILISTNYKHMRLVSFADVYDLRADASKAETNGLLVYLVSWLSYCFLPFFIANAGHPDDDAVKHVISAGIVQRRGCIDSSRSAFPGRQFSRMGKVDTVDADIGNRGLDGFAIL